MSDYPPQVEAFHDALRRFVAVRDVDTGLKAIDDIETSVYSLPGEFGDFPHALLPHRRRSAQRSVGPHRILANRGLKRLAHSRIPRVVGT